MIMRIECLKLESFKGVKNAEYHFGDETHIFGKNATGKTTIADAFFWLLFDRDSRGNTPGSDKFREKPVDENGQERHHLDIVVEAVCTLDGKPFKLKRLQRENWVTKRGSKDAVYQGNSSTYWINDVETKVTDYKARINGIANGELFSLVARMGAFNAMDEKGRRTVLIDMAGRDVDVELFAKDEYLPLAHELKARDITLDEYKSMLASQRKTINQEMTLIPAKIDEVNHMMPEFTDQEIHDAELNLKDTDEDIERCKSQISAHKMTDTFADDAAKEMVTVQNELVIAKRKIVDEFDAKKIMLENERKMALKQMETAQSAQETASAVASRTLVDKQKREANLEKVRAKYREVYAKQFEKQDKPDICPTCGQELPDEVWEKTEELRKAQFEDQKKADLKELTATGLEAKEDFEAASKAYDDAKAMLEKADAEFAESAKYFKQTSDTLSAYPAEPDLQTEQIKEIEGRLAQLNERRKLSSDQIVSGLQRRIAELTERNDRAKSILQKREQKESCQKRIEELTNKMSDLGQKKAEIEMNIFLIEQFVTERCAVLEDSINEKFRSIKWKLFNQQINGGLVDCCECLVPGDGILVPYSGTNTAARITADIEIIDALSKHFDIVAPVFVDNAECINYIPKPQGQLITMSVSDDDALRCEIKNEEVA